MTRAFWNLLLGVISFSSQGALKLLPVVQNGIEYPTYVTPAPGRPGVLYIAEQAGRIRVLKDGVLQKKPFLDIEKRVTSGGEMGFLGIAFHPDFAKNKRYFVYYTTTKNRKRLNVVEELKEGESKGKTILETPQPFTNHNGGHITFHKGVLYVAKGDGGYRGDPFKNSQNPQSHLGKILRIDVDKTPAKVEVFAWGLRNPWRFSFDRETGDLWAGDVGQDTYEEIDIIEEGKDYGWPILEGNACYEKEDCKKDGLVPPIHTYPREDGYSVTGGYVYRGKAIPELNGVYIYADYGSGKIWKLTIDRKTRQKTKNELLFDSGQAISSFGETEDGEILVVGYAGIVFRLVNE